MTEAVLELPAVASREAETCTNCGPDIETIKARFAAQFPRIQQMVSRQHYKLYGDMRDEAVADTLAFAWRYYRNMAMEGGNPDRVLGSIIRFSAKHVRAGKKIGRSPDAEDVLNQTGEHSVRYLPHHQEDKAAKEAHAAVRSRLPDPADEAISDLDYRAFLDSLSPNDRNLAESLVAGQNMSDVAKERGVSHQAIHDRRKKMAKKWADRTGYFDPLSR